MTIIYYTTPLAAVVQNRSCIVSSLVVSCWFTTFLGFKFQIQTVHNSRCFHMNSSIIPGLDHHCTLHGVPADVRNCLNWRLKSWGVSVVGGAAVGTLVIHGLWPESWAQAAPIMLPTTLNSWHWQVTLIHSPSDTQKQWWKSKQFYLFVWSKTFHNELVVNAWEEQEGRKSTSIERLL